MSDEMHQTKNRKNEDSSLDDAFIECTAQRQPIHPPGNMAKASSNSHDSSLTNASATATAPSTTTCDSKKWNCEYCTYENFPLSIKCTMCRALKTLVNEDIFRIKDVDESLNENIVGACEKRYSNDIDECQPWICQTCRCSNPTRRSGNMMCRQCGTQRGKEVTVDNIHEQIAPLKISQDIDVAARPDSSVERNSPISYHSASAPAKWMCQTCTFENWPKSIKCAMCESTRIISRQHNSSPQNVIHDRDQIICGYDVDIKQNAKNSRSPFGINDLRQNSPVHDLDSSNNRRISRHRQTDWAWLQACLGVVDGDLVPVEQYLSNGGDPARQLTTAEVALLNRTSAFDAGYTLIHLAIRFQREDILSSLLSRISGGGSGIKRAPSYVAPDLATAIRRNIASNIRHKKGFPCRYMHDITTFCLPADLEELPQAIQDQLFEELLDRDAQQQLTVDAAVINWSLELTVRLGSRLYALWNRSAGDCLLDAVLQATWGVFDRDNTLRRALADTLHHAGRSFYSRWREHECLQADQIGYEPDELQLEADWSRALHAAGQQGRSLHQLHVWALAHVTRRPLIVYAVDIVNSFRGEALGYAGFQGVYLPLLWDHTFCSKSPICLGYTRGHFSALVPIEPYSQASNSTLNEEEDGQDEVFLPLTDSEGKLLPVHFLTRDEIGHEDVILQQWVRTCSTEGGLLVARQRTRQKPLLVAQMVEEWLNHYRRIAQQTAGPFPPRLSTHVQDFSSDGETDEE
ncbi:ubiquitin thioesterase trabid [Arctopsyche grandis]|uniref:ubiquitin thioesterase trabid n=1 Tax=Arctopsyche grandis TaxID=121162 RepID=UPI00406D6BFB